jgi:hypothetical protein
MKYWLLAALLANLALFLVEFHSGVFEPGAMDYAENGPQKKQGTDSSKKHDTSDPIHLVVPSDRVTGNLSEEAKKNAALQKVEQPVLQGDMSALEDKSSPLSWEVNLTPNQTGASVFVNREADAVKEKPVPSPAFPSPVAQPPAQTAAKTLMFSPDTHQAQSARVAPTLPVSPSTASSLPAERKSESREKAIETPSAAQTSQKDGLIETAQPARAPDKSGKVEKLTAPAPKAETQHEKNKNGKSASAVKEIPQPQQTSSKQDNVKTSCYLAGPIAHVETLTTLLREFRPRLTELLMSPTQGRKTRRHATYVVYYPALPSMEESFSKAATLKNSLGIKELYVIGDGDLKGAISLGVFHNERNAESAKSKFAQKGLQVQIKPRVPVENAYKVRMRWTAQQENTAKQLENALLQNYLDTKQIQSCE